MTKFSLLETGSNSGNRIIILTFPHVFKLNLFTSLVQDTRQIAVLSVVSAVCHWGRKTNLRKPLNVELHQSVFWGCVGVDDVVKFSTEPESSSPLFWPLLLLLHVRGLTEKNQH